MADIYKNTDPEVARSTCPNCGHPANVTRIDGKYLVQEIRKVLNFESGFLFTIRALAVNPGENIKAFLTHDRNRLVKPVLFIIATSLVYSLLNSIFNFEDGYVNYDSQAGSATTAINQWIQGNYGYANIIMAIFIGVWLKVFFRKYPFNFFEILILLCYVMGMGMLIYAVFGIVQGLTHIQLMVYAIFIGFIYTTFAVGHFYNPRKPISYMLSFFAYLLGMITFSIAAVATGMIIDLLIGT
jgi:hypothetical protein